MKQKNTSLSGESLCKAIEKGKSLKIPGGIYDKSVKNLLTVPLVPHYNIACHKKKSDFRTQLPL